MKNIISLIDTNVIINFISCISFFVHYLVCDQETGIRRKSKKMD